MSQDLQLAIDWGSLCASHSFTVLIESGYSDVRFLTNQLIVMHVVNKHGVILLLFNKTLQHFHQIASKFGINLTALQEKGLLFVVEVLKETNSIIKGEKSGDLVYENEGLCDVLSKVKDFTGRARDQFEHFILLVDDLTVLMNLGVSTKNIINFVQSCRYLTKSNNGCLAVSVNINEDEEDENEMSLCRLLQHSCDSCIRVADLATGLSKDIHGQLTATFNDRKRTDNVESKIIRLQFKIEDRRVLTFAPGMSTGVL